MTGKTLCGFVVAVVLGVGHAGSGQAASITWEFEGTVRLFVAQDYGVALVAGSLGVAVDAPVSGWLTYESTTPDAFPPDGSYFGALSAFNLTIGSYTAALDPAEDLNDFYVRLLGPGPDLDHEFA